MLKAACSCCPPFLPSSLTCALSANVRRCPLPRLFLLRWRSAAGGVARFAVADGAELVLDFRGAYARTYAATRCGRMTRWVNGRRRGRHSPAAATGLCARYATFRILLSLLRPLWRRRLHCAVWPGHSLSLRTRRLAGVGTFTASFAHVADFRWRMPAMPSAGLFYYAPVGSKGANVAYRAGILLLSIPTVLSAMAVGCLLGTFCCWGRMEARTRRWANVPFGVLPTCLYCYLLRQHDVAGGCLPRRACCHLLWRLLFLHQTTSLAL